MHEVNNLKELEELIGSESVNKCFTEFMAVLMSLLKREHDLHNKCAVMSEIEMKVYIEAIGRYELQDEVKTYKEAAPRIPYPRYLKAILVSLEALGYDNEWIHTTFRDALEARYLKGENKPNTDVTVGSANTNLI